MDKDRINSKKMKIHRLCVTSNEIGLPRIPPVPVLRSSRVIETFDKNEEHSKHKVRCNRDKEKYTQEMWRQKDFWPKETKETRILTGLWDPNEDRSDLNETRLRVLSIIYINQILFKVKTRLVVPGFHQSNLSCWVQTEHPSTIRQESLTLPTTQMTFKCFTTNHM